MFRQEVYSPDTQGNLDLVGSFGEEDHGIQKVLERDPTVLLTVYNLEHLPMNWRTKVKCSS